MKDIAAGDRATSPVIKEASDGEEIERILRFRYSVYVEEMGKPIPGANHDTRCLEDELDDQSTHLFAERDGQIVGTVRIVWGRHGLPDSYIGWYGLERFRMFNPSALSFTGRLMVAARHRRGPLAIILAKEAYRRGLRQGVVFDFIHTTRSLIPLFERLGHRRYKDDFVDPELGPRTPLVLVLGDIDHLRGCRSPFGIEAKRGNQIPDPVEWFRHEFLHKQEA